MYRTHNCGELTSKNISNEVILSGWVQKIRNKGFIVWIDLRDRYGITQIIFDQKRSSKKIIDKAQKIGREFVIKINGEVIKRESVNPKIKTGEIEVLVKDFNVLNSSLIPPFTIQDNSDGGEELRLKYRYLDIRRNPIKNNLILRSKITREIRNFLSNKDFIEIETPYLIKSTPEGARDFIVPSRMNPGNFYALPQSPQTFKQLLMVGGMDKYFQIVKCFRDEDLRADRQPEFSQIDCEMSFVTREEVMQQFEELICNLIYKFKGVKIDKIPVLTYEKCINLYGSDKPDTRFGMELNNLSKFSKNKGFKPFDLNESILGICVQNGSSFSRKKIDQLNDWTKRPEINANGLFWIKYNEDGSIKSSIDKFFNSDELIQWIKFCKGKKGDLLLILAGKDSDIKIKMGLLRLEIAERLELRDFEKYSPLWVIDFPLFEWNEEEKSFNSVHHPFTSPIEKHLNLLNSNPKKVIANSYDLVINGNEIGGGSIRINSSDIQKRIFTLLDFSEEEANNQFGYLIDSFKYGAPPHGGIALGLDRLVAIIGGQEIIRDFIAFPKNNSGKDLMINSPSEISNDQLNELKLKMKP
tara:strand:+ start:568 stop:2316 length:1749 start_codon:yes stop_codon:yes gene_type:complete